MLKAQVLSHDAVKITKFFSSTLDQKVNEYILIALA